MSFSGYCLCFLLLVSLLSAQVLYVDAVAGNDNNSGTSAAPFKTLSKASTASVAGTTIYIRPGVYRETLTPKSGTPSAPITYAAIIPGTVYIRGADAIRGFVKYNGTSPAFASTNVYVADLPTPWSFLQTNDDSTTDLKPSVHMVALANADGSISPEKQFTLARIPNKKVVTDWKRAEYYWRADGGATAGGFSTTVLMDVTNDTVPADIEQGNLKTINANLTGAMLWALDSKDSHWYWYRVIRTHDQATGTITINTDRTGTCNTNTGVCTGCQPRAACRDANADTGGRGFGQYTKYFVENHPALLDTEGEYFVDKTVSPPKIYIHPFGGAITSSQDIEVGRRQNGIVLTGVSNVQFYGITVDMCEYYAVHINNWNQLSSKNILFSNVTVQFSRRGFSIIQAVNGQNPSIGTRNYTIEHSVIRYINDYAFSHNQGYWSCSLTNPSCRINANEDIVLYNNEWYELGFRGEYDSVSGGNVLAANKFRFINNYVHHVAHNGFEIKPTVVSGASYPYNDSSILSANVLIKDNIFEYTCILSPDCGGLKIFGESFKDSLIIGNVARYIWGWSVAGEEKNKMKPGDPGYGPTKLYWDYRLGFAFGFYHDYATGFHMYKNFAYDVQTCYQWTQRLNSRPLMFYNNLAANCYYDLQATYQLDHIYTDMKNNMFITGQRNGIRMTRTGAHSFQGNFTMDNNIWFMNGWDTRSDAVYRRGDLDINLQDNRIPNGGNPTRTLPEIQNITSTNLNSIQSDPLFLYYNITASRTMTLMPTASQAEWTDFQIAANSPAVDAGASLPAELLRVLNLFGIPVEQVGAKVDIGPLEYGVSYNKNTKGCSR